MQNLKFSVVNTGEELKSVQKLCCNVFGENEAEMLVDFFDRSPRKDKNLIYYAYDCEQEKCVGTISYLDLLFEYEGISLKTAEYAVAATDSAYRGQRINTRLTQMLFKTCYERGTNLVILEGIPYFYRNYGFNYAVPMCKEMFDLDRKDLAKAERISIRNANLEDAAFIYEKYLLATEKVDICKIKERAIIEAQIGVYQSDNNHKGYYIVEDSDLTDPQRIGYFALDTTSAELIISDIADNLSFDVYESILKFLQEEVLPTKEKTVLFASVPDKNKFIAYLRMKGSRRVGKYAWQIKIFDDYKFFMDILPLLEKRVQNSIYHDEKIEFYYNNYKKLIHFSIDHGKITLCQETWKPKWEVNLTSQGAVKLFFGHNSLGEILDFLPDCMVTEHLRDIVEVLFPKVNVHFYMNY